MDSLEDLADFHKVYLLTQFAIRICKIYDAFFEDKERLQEDEHLNTLYVALVIKTDRLLDHPKMAGFRSKRPNFHQSFAGRLNEISKEYESSLRIQLCDFYDDAHSLVAELDADMGGYRVGDPTTYFFLEEVDAAIEEHKAFLASPQGQPTKLPISSPEIPSPKRIEVHQLKPQHYQDRKGVLSLSPTVDIEIAKQGKIKTPEGKDYAQYKLLRLLFKSVNSLNNGITFSTFLGVKYDKNNPKHIKKIRNTIAYINKIIAGRGGPKRLIRARTGKIFVDSSYL